MLQLSEICSQIQLAQTNTRRDLASKLHLPRVSQHDEYHSIAVHLDGCLDKWEKELPHDFQLENVKRAGNRTTRAQRYLLHLL